MRRISGLSATECKPFDAGSGQAMISIVKRAPSTLPTVVSPGYCRPETKGTNPLISGGLDDFYLGCVKIAFDVLTERLPRLGSAFPMPRKRCADKQSLQIVTSRAFARLAFGGLCQRHPVPRPEAAFRS